jgi:hypothetical protein
MFSIFSVGCVLNRILGLYNNGPCRISSVTAIVTPMPDHEKNLDSNERDTINGNVVKNKYTKTILKYI